MWTAPSLICDEVIIEAAVAVVVPTASAVTAQVATVLIGRFFMVEFRPGWTALESI